MSRHPPASSFPPDPPNLFWRRPPTITSLAIRRAAAIAATVLDGLGPRPADRCWILLVEADSTGPTEPNEEWTIDEFGDGSVRGEGPGFELEIVERDAYLRHAAVEHPTLANAIATSATPFIAVLVERDGTAISICECRLHLIGGRRGRA